MDVVSLCPFRVGSILWQPRRGAWAYTVVCKATYQLTQGESPLADEQEYPTDYDNHWNDDTARSLYCPSDLVPFKARADIMLVGHAFSPRGEPARSVVARMIVGNIDKAIEVWVDRAWSQDGLLREGQRFAKMPLRYERAAGGPDSVNPVGMRFDARPDVYGNVPVPNLQPTGVLLASPGDLFDPIGFGPIAPAWPERATRLGAYAASFQHGAWHAHPLPEDVDRAYFNAAPRDQQIDELRDNERIVLENLHPEHPRLVTSLPGLHPRAFVEQQRGAPPQNMQLSCDTLWIDTDRKICTLTWRGTLPLEKPDHQGRVLIAAERPGQRLTWAEIERLTSVIDDPTDDGYGAPASASSHAALAGLSAPRAVRHHSDDMPPIAPGDVHHIEGGRVITGVPEVGRVPDLPFVRAEARPKPGPPPSSSGLPFSPAPEPARAAPPPGNMGLPFAPASDAARAAPPPSSNAGLPFTPAPTSPRAQRPPLSTETGSLGSAAPSWLSPTRSGAPAHSGSTPAPPTARRPSAPAPPMPPAPVKAPVAPAPVPSAPLPPPAVPQAPAPVVAPPADSPWSSGAAGRPMGADRRPGAPSSIDAAPAAPMPQPMPVAAGALVGVTAGAAAASDAAAAAGSWALPPAPAPATSGAAPAPPMIRPNPRMQTRDITDLIWFDPKSLDGIRKHPRWKEILDEKKQPEQPEAGFDEEVEEEPEIEPPEVKDRRDVFTILTRADSIDAEGINEEVTDAVTEDGTFVPPLVMLAGEIQFPFDELETLKANVTAVTPLMAGDKKLKDTVDTVNELLKTPWLQSSTGVAEGLTAKVKEAFAQGNRMLPPSYLDQHTERMLLESRHYQRRTVFGEPHIRTLVVPYIGNAPIPTYLPDALTKKLPMYQRFRVRLIAEVHLQQDQYESYPTALRVVAFSRMQSLSMRR